MEVNSLSSPPTHTENTPVTENCCHSQVEFLKFDYTWTITNFSFLPQESGQSLKTSSFSRTTDDPLKWSLEMYPRGTDRNCKNYVSLFLSLESSSGNKVTAKFELTMLNAKKEKIKETSALHTFPPRSDWGFKAFVARELLDGTKGVLPNDEVTIYCKISVVDDIINSYGQKIKLKVPKRTLSEEYGLMLESGKFSDITLSVEGGKFQVHKIVLSTRSPVFQAMFEHEMNENKHNNVNITDVDYEVLREMLEYIYTGKTTKIEKMADRLLAAADKYALEELRVMCEAVLYKNLSIDNASKTLILSDLHSADQLKTHTINFINRYTLEVMETSGWKNMVQTHPHLIAEAYRASKTPTKKEKTEVPS